MLMIALLPCNIGYICLFVPDLIRLQLLKHHNMFLHIQLEAALQ